MNRLIALIVASWFLASAAWAKEPPVYTGLLSNTGAGGYDTVSYFEEGQPAKGSTQFSTEYQGATWRFVNAENLARFKANPERFVPAYGGYCAWAVSHGKLAKGDPQHWNIQNGRLFLNYNQSIQESWQENTNELITQADANWPEVLK